MAAERQTSIDEEESGLEAPLGAALLHLIAPVRDDVVAPFEDQVISARRLAEEGALLAPGSEAAIVTTHEADRTFTVVGASRGAAAALEGTSWPRRGSIVQRVLESGGAVETTHAQSLHVLGVAMTRAGFECVRAVPLLIDTGTEAGRSGVGVYLALKRHSHGFSHHERRLIDAYTPLVALTLATAEQRRLDATQAHRWALGVDVALDLASAVTPADVTHRLLVRATEAVDADRASLTRLDRDDLIIEDTFDRDDRPGHVGMRTQVRNHPALVRALTTRRVERIMGRPSYTLPEAREAMEGTKQTIVLPLLLGGEVMGFLSIYRRNDADFSDADVLTLQLIGSVAVLALRNTRLYADAHAAKETMSEFLDVVVHDLRSPLTVVGGYCSMMRDGVFGQPPSAWMRPLSIVENKIHEAQRLVDQLLLAARLESGQIPVSQEDLDLSQVVTSAVARAEPQAQLDGAEIAASLPGHPVWAIADRAHVDQIVDNLVNNALAYGGSPAEVEVSVREGEELGVAVTDKGPGVPAEQRQRIFDRFFRGHEGVQGSGLGLYVSRRLAAESGGTLELDEEWTDGSRFVLRLRGGGRAAA